MAKITVITPVYNGEKFIAAALDSLMAQTMADWNLIVINDGSTDTTSHILAKYQDPRVTIINQENGGEAVARNAGLDAAGGDYIAFLDADDLYLPNALEWMSTYLDSHPETGVVFSDGYLCNDQDSILTHLTDHRPGIHEGMILEYLVLDSAVVTVPVCTMTRRSAILQSHARFDPELVIGPDWDFWIQLAVDHQFGYLDKLICMYRIHQTNISKTVGNEKRHKDLARGRFKVMKAAWFSSLAGNTRKRFFYHLLIELLAGNTEQQLEVLESEQLRSLDPKDQDHLWRLTGMNILCRGENAAAVQVLTRSLEKFPGTKKTSLILHLAKTSPSLARQVVKVWEGLSRLFRSIREVGKPRPKPVPMLISL